MLHGIEWTPREEESQSLLKQRKMNRHVSYDKICPPTKLEPITGAKAS